MDGDENISGCNEFGLPVNDVILASHARSNSGSADINNFDFWRLNSSPRMVCPSNERPLFYFENFMKFLDPGGSMAENRNSPSKQAEKTFIRSEEYWEEPCGAQFSTQVNLARDNNESEEAVAAIGSAPQANISTFLDRVVLQLTHDCLCEHVMLRRRGHCQAKRWKKMTYFSTSRIRMS